MNKKSGFLTFGNWLKAYLAPLSLKLANEKENFQFTSNSK